MNNKEQILELYYIRHLKQNEIAKIINKSTQYISKIVREDCRNEKEKEFREKNNAEKRIEYLKEYFKNYIRNKEEDEEYNKMIEQHKQDIRELSYTSDDISDYTYSKWNRSIYNVNSKGNLSIDKKINVSIDVPKSINRNTKIKSQRYKKMYTHSY